MVVLSILIRMFHEDQSQSMVERAVCPGGATVVAHG